MIEQLMPELELTVIADGGVTSAQGFIAAGIHAGFRRNPQRLDLALVKSDEPCPTAGVFTQNVFCAAPVLLCREQLGPDGAGISQAVIINSGNANAATGPQGLTDARLETELVADVLGCGREDVLVASTGVIGVYLPMAPFESSLGELAAKLSRTGGHDAACAIMTTDTCSKEAAVSYQSADPLLAGAQITVGGMAKGSGMIMPNMATMIAVITTDAPLSAPLAKRALSRAVAASFNKVTVDSDTSTNDCCFLMASGKAAEGLLIEEGSCAFEEFCAALEAVCVTLAKKMARDGEGASRLVTVTVAGAASDEDADLAARSIANSPLVKTAICGHDANWGRIAMALGKSGARFAQEGVDIDIMGIPVCRQGLSVGFDEDEALRRFKDEEIKIFCDLHAGPFETTMWTCDLTHDYITINGDYRT